MSRLWSLLGEVHFEPIGRLPPSFMPWRRWYRRVFRWRTDAVALVFLLGLFAGYALASSAASPAAAAPSAVTVPPAPGDADPDGAEDAPAAARRADGPSQIVPPDQVGSMPVATRSPVPSEAVGSNVPTASGSQDVRVPTKLMWHYDPEISWYGPGFYGRRTACGLALTTTLIGVAHRTLPCGTLIEFRWDGVVLRVPVVDRGPYVAGRQWDLTGGACVALRHCFSGPIEWRIP